MNWHYFFSALNFLAAVIYATTFIFSVLHHRKVKKQFEKDFERIANRGGSMAMFEMDSNSSLSELFDFSKKTTKPKGDLN